VTTGSLKVGSVGMAAAPGTLYVAGDGALTGIGTIVGHVINDGNIVVFNNGQIVGPLDGAGATQVVSGASLTVDHVVQGDLTLGGVAGTPAFLTINASDASGNPLGSSEIDAPGRLLPLFASSSVGGASTPVPEPGTLVLLAIGIIAAIPSLKRKHRLAGRKTRP
jgi:hypothetical protein